MRTAVLIVASLVLALCAGIYGLSGKVLDALAQPLDPSAEIRTVNVPQGLTAPSLIEFLQKEGLVEKGFWPRWHAEYLKKPKKLQHGEFKLSASMTPLQLIETVASGKVVRYTVVIPPASNTAQTVTILIAKGILSAEDAKKGLSDSSLLEKLKVEAKHLDGFLYSDVYEIPKGLDAQTVYGQLTRRFHKALPENYQELLKARGLSLRELVTLASLVEKGPVKEVERRQYAALLYARLKKRLALESKAARNYARDLPNGFIDAAAESYDTFGKGGLPAGPICNPSKSALAAALDPAEGKPIYLVARDDGSHVFCEDQECYFAALQRWRPGQQPSFPRRFAR